MISLKGGVNIDIFGGDSSNHIDNAMIDTTGHCKIVNTGSITTVYLNDSIINTNAMNVSNIRFGFVLNANNESLTFKNFIVFNQ